MKKKPYVEIDVFPDGDVSMEGMNFVGTECNVFMKPFEKLFKMKSRKNKGDIRKVERVTNQRAET